MSKNFETLWSRDERYLLNKKHSEHIQKIENNQPKRLNPEALGDGFFPPPWNFYDYPEKTEGWIAFQREMRKDPQYYLQGCDSPTPDNKENQGDIEKSISAKCARCNFPPNDGKRRIYCMCGQ